MPLSSPILAPATSNAHKDVLKERPLPHAHFVERHYIHPKASWPEGAKLLAGLFPRDTRHERPKPWYARLAGTHWVGQIPPGNGPFYVPEWAFEDLPPETREAMIKVLTNAGFKAMIAHVVFVPENSEYLAAAMRAAQTAGRTCPWNVNPVTYRAYLYPKLAGVRQRPLREFTTTRWRV